MVDQNFRRKSDGALEVGRGLVQLADGKVGEGALVELRRRDVVFELGGQFADVVLRALMGSDCREGEGTENGEFRIENGELLGLNGYWLRRMVGCRVKSELVREWL